MADRETFLVAEQFSFVLSLKKKSLLFDIKNLASFGGRRWSKSTYIYGHHLLLPAVNCEKTRWESANPLSTSGGLFLMTAEIFSYSQGCAANSCRCCPRGLGTSWFLNPLFSEGAGGGGATLTVECLLTPKSSHSFPLYWKNVELYYLQEKSPCSQHIPRVTFQPF